MAYNPKTGKGFGPVLRRQSPCFPRPRMARLPGHLYDFFRWLYLYGFMAVKLGCHPILMVKAMMRYRWMVSYLTAAHMVDRHTWVCAARSRAMPTTSSFSRFCTTRFSVCET